MLSSDYLFTLTDEISNMYEELNTSIINDMARRIAKMNYASESSIFQAERAIETGALYDDIVKKISIQTGKSQEELKRLFKEAGFRNYENNLRKHSMPYKNIKLSEKAKNILIAGINKTGGVLHNMTMATANEAQNDFIHITDLAYNQIVNGVMDYNTAIRYAVKDLANKGLKVVDYKTGYKQRIDSAVRTCVLTGVNQTTGPMTEIQRQEVGADGYETTAHSGARPEHALWQGKQFYADKPVKGYEDFKTATGYGTVTGLKGANCRHDFFWVFLGEDEPSYTKSEIKALNNKSVKYNGKEMTISEAETTMRYIERKTREWKRQANALKAAGLDNTFEKMKAREWTEKYKDFANKTGIPRRNERLVVYDNQNMTNTNKNDIITFHKAKTKEEAMRFAFEELGITAHYDDFKLEIANMVNEQIYIMKKDFPNMELYEIERFPKKGFSNKIQGAYVVKRKSLMLRNLSIKLLKNNAIIQNEVGFWSTNSEKHIIRHELGHAISNRLFEEKSHKIEEIKNIMKKTSENKKENLSIYGFYNVKEFISESIAEYYDGNPRETAKRVVEILKA